MGSHHAGMVIEHIALVIQHHFQVVGAEQPVSAGLPIGDIGQVIDAAGQQHKKHQAEAAVFQKGLWPQAGILHPIPGPDQRQPRPGVEAGPLAGGAQTEEQAGQGQVPQPVLREEQVHEQIHQQDEEHGIGVDGGDAGLDKMHEVSGKDQGAGSGDRPAAEQLLQKDIHQRQHQHAEEGAREAPAEGSHAEDGDAPGEDDLTQRRVGDLIGIDAVQVLPGGAGVVDFIKIAGVHEGLLFGAETLLIRQSRLPAGQGEGLPCPVQGHYFPQPHVAGASNAQAAPAEALLQRHRVPFQHLGVALAEAGQGLEMLPVGGVFNGIFPDAHAGKEHQGIGTPLPQLHCDAAVFHVHKVLRGLGIAQVPEGHQGIGQADAGHDGSVPPVQPALPLPAEGAAAEIGQAQVKDNQQQCRQKGQRIFHQKIHKQQ